MPSILAIGVRMSHEMGPVTETASWAASRSVSTVVPSVLDDGEEEMAITRDEIDGWVSLERGEVDRRIYSDDEIFELEMEQIFGRAWLFLFWLR